jgi:hypothetical protein
VALFRRWLRRTDRALGATAEGPARAPWWERNRPALEVAGIWLEALGVLTAAVLGISQYRANSHAEQVNKTLKYLDRYQEERIYTARKSLEDAWNAKSAQVFEALKSPDGEAALARLLNETIAQERLAPAISTVLDFYDELEVCAAARLCDRDTAVRFFGKYAWDLYGLLTPYIRAQREALHDGLIGSGIDRLSRAYRKRLPQEDEGPRGPPDR